MEAVRAWTEIDLDALASNLAVVRRRAGDGMRVMLVVKQDAYGHGAVAVAHYATRAGVGALGVGTSGEALALRRAGVRLPILILGTVVEEELDACLRHDIHVGLHSSDRCRRLQALGRETGLVARVHLNVDTGMGRLGVPPALALTLLREVRDSSQLELAGIMTHVASPDGALDPFTAVQLETFERLVADARAEGLRGGWVHALNSATLFTSGGGDALRARGHDTVRVGIAAYGALPRHLPGAAELVPVMSVRTRIAFLKDVAAGTPVGYASTWRAPRATRIATVPIGYGHGLPWGLRGGEVLIRGRRAPIVGRISMDYATLDVGHLSGIEVGQVVTLVGRDGDDELCIEDMARGAGTIPYELTCSLGRIDRVFRGGEDVTVPQQRPALRAPAAEPRPAQALLARAGPGGAVAGQEPDSGRS